MNYSNKKSKKRSKKRIVNQIYKNALKKGGVLSRQERQEFNELEKELRKYGETSPKSQRQMWEDAFENPRASGSDRNSHTSGNSSVNIQEISSKDRPKMPTKLERIKKKMDELQKDYQRQQQEIEERMKTNIEGQRKIQELTDTSVDIEDFLPELSVLIEQLSSKINTLEDKIIENNRQIHRIEEQIRKSSDKPLFLSNLNLIKKNLHNKNEKMFKGLEEYKKMINNFKSKREGMISAFEGVMYEGNGGKNKYYSKKKFISKKIKKTFTKKLKGSGGRSCKMCRDDEKPPPKNTSSMKRNLPAKIRKIREETEKSMRDFQRMQERELEKLEKERQRLDKESQRLGKKSDKISEMLARPIFDPSIFEQENIKRISADEEENIEKVELKMESVTKKIEKINTDIQEHQELLEFVPDDVKIQSDLTKLQQEKKILEEELERYEDMYIEISTKDLKFGGGFGSCCRSEEDLPKKPSNMIKEEIRKIQKFLSEITTNRDISDEEKINIINEELEKVKLIIEDKRKKLEKAIKKRNQVARNELETTINIQESFINNLNKQKKIIQNILSHNVTHSKSLENKNITDKLSQREEQIRRIEEGAEKLSAESQNSRDICKKLKDKKAKEAAGCVMMGGL